MSTIRFHRWLLNVRWLRRPAVHLAGFFLIGLMSTVSLSNGPQVEEDGVTSLSMGPLSIGQEVSAQSVQSSSDFSAEDVDSYADALLKIEAIRQQTWSELEAEFAPQPVPEVACHDEQTLEGLSEALQQSVVRFCEQSIVLVRESGLSVTQFNQITANQEEDRNLANAVQAAIARLQQADALTSGTDGESDGTN
ncbi:MAG: DUF4168 domain-containing protein [Merismopedia sp. SIO2A8]|nr:DUF4168 domain-containing protein [Symploca sp. SIO2B6]NET54369.1 DUF4168 domain-containing protein [Merismopedia sp. SIO2A8]